MPVILCICCCIEIFKLFKPFIYLNCLYIYTYLYYIYAYYITIVWYTNMKNLRLIIIQFFYFNIKYDNKNLLLQSIDCYGFLFLLSYDVLLLFSCLYCSTFILLLFLCFLLWSTAAGAKGPKIEWPNCEKRIFRQTLV